MYVPAYPTRIDSNAKYHDERQALPMPRCFIARTCSELISIKLQNCLYLYP